MYAVDTWNLREACKIHAVAAPFLNQLAVVVVNISQDWPNNRKLDCRFNMSTIPAYKANQVTPSYFGLHWAYKSGDSISIAMLSCVCTAVPHTGAHLTVEGFICERTTSYRPINPSTYTLCRAECGSGIGWRVCPFRVG